MPHALVTINKGCLQAGKTGKVLHAQEFEKSPGTLWYWVVIPERHASVGLWFRADCLTVTEGKLPKPDKAKLFRHRVEKDGCVSHFFIDKSTKDVLIEEGYTVVYDPKS